MLLLTPMRVSQVAERVFRARRRARISFGRAGAPEAGDCLPPHLVRQPRSGPSDTPGTVAHHLTRNPCVGQKKIQSATLAPPRVLPRAAESANASCQLN